jgi:hypothetical protein
MSRLFSFDALCGAFEAAPWADVFSLDDTEPKYVRHRGVNSTRHRIRARNPPTPLDCESRPGLTQADVQRIRLGLLVERGWSVTTADLALAIEHAATRH